MEFALCTYLNMRRLKIMNSHDCVVAQCYCGFAPLPYIITFASLLCQIVELLYGSYTELNALASGSDPTISMTIRVRVYTMAYILLTSAWSH